MQLLRLMHAISKFMVVSKQAMILVQVRWG